MVLGAVQRELVSLQQRGNRRPIRRGGGTQGDVRIQHGIPFGRKLQSIAHPGAFVERLHEQ